MKRPAGRLLWLATFGALAGCGPSDPAGPPLPTGKVAPSLTRRVRGATLEEWLARAVSPTPAVRAEAPWALSELGTDPAVLRPLLERLGADASADVRYAVVVVLGRVEMELGPALERILLAALTAPEGGTSTAAKAAWRARGGAGAPALAQGLAQGSEAQAREITRLLGDLGADALAAAPALVQALGHASIAVRLNAGRALEGLGATAARALGDGLAQARGESALAILDLLRAQGGAALPAQDALLATLRSAEPEVARGAEEALVALGSAALPALDALAGAPEDPASAAAARIAARVREAGGR